MGLATPELNSPVLGPVILLEIRLADMLYFSDFSELGKAGPNGSYCNSDSRRRWHYC